VAVGQKPLAGKKNINTFQEKREGERERERERERDGEAGGGDDDGPRVHKPRQRAFSHARLASRPFLPGSVLTHIPPSP
jgi:hypothetical protein